MNNIIPTAGVVVYDSGTVLLVRREEPTSLKGSYCIPAGVIEEGESPSRTALRKLNDETGLEAMPADIFELPETYIAKILKADGEKMFSLVVYACSRFSGSLRAAPDETPEWVDRSRILKGELDQLTLAKYKRNHCCRPRTT
jgi:ADP-ribose pyrophosphatase YjhB (NUDIX family)